MKIGMQIRDLRIRLNLTQEELAERSNLTKGFISQVERNLTSPSIDSLHDILVALGTDFSRFFNENTNETVLYKSNEYYTSKDMILKNKIKWCVSSSQSLAMEPIILELDVNGKSKSYYPYEGEDFGYVLQGQIELRYGKQSFLLNQGDSFYTQCHMTREIFNRSDNVSKILWVETPPNF